MMNIPRTAFALALALVAIGIDEPGSGSSTAVAQTAAPCTLLKVEDVQPLASKETVAEGVSTSLAAAASSTCKYAWGSGVRRYKLDVTVSEASIYSGATPDLIKQGLQASVKAGTADAVVPDAGETAVFKADSPAYVHSTAYAKGRIVRVDLDGIDALDKKAQVIELLKLAVSRL
jgi:hypothetical protein